MPPAQQGNNRFAHYCPYCQVSTAPSPLPPGLREPPSYTSLPTTRQKFASSAAGGDGNGPSEAPPPYSPTASPPSSGPPRVPGPASSGGSSSEKRPDDPPPDTLHFLHHPHDTIPSLSLRYGVPAPVLRAANSLPSDHLLPARRTVVIPGSHYPAGVSLSPRPPRGEDDEARTSKVRRFMTSCKVHDYDLALLYLEQAGYDLDDAVERWRDDERWERENPLADSASGTRGIRGGRRAGPASGSGPSGTTILGRSSVWRRAS